MLSVEKEGATGGLSASANRAGVYNTAGQASSGTRRIVLLVSSSVLALNLTSCTSHETPPIQIPPAASIKEMQADLVGYPAGSTTRQDFSMPAEDYAAICAALSAGEPDPNPAKWQVLGGLEMTTNSGEHLSFSLYTTSEFTAENGERHVGLAYSTSQRDYYRGGDATELVRLLKSAFERTDLKSNNSLPQPR